MRLDVYMLSTEKLLGSVDSELLDDVDILASAVITLSRITLSVLVGKG